MSTSSTSSHSFLKETVPVEPAVNSTPEPSRRYVQWKEDDVGLLLTDLEQPGHYGKWKENKSGFSKRVAEQVFKNVMYHEAIKFKARWLETRFKHWNQQLTSPEVEQDEAAINKLREKMFKEFPYYDRCKPIFMNYHNTTTALDSPAVQPSIATSTAVVVADNTADNNIITFEPIHMTNEPTSPTLNMHHHQHQQHQQRIEHSLSFTAIKKRKVNDTYNNNRESTTNKLGGLIGNVSSNSNSIFYSIDGITEEKKIKIMELEIELKKMDYQERMQEMKLEQLRLEIELQRLKRDTVITNHQERMQEMKLEQLRLEIELQKLKRDTVTTNHHNSDQV